MQHPAHDWPAAPEALEAGRQFLLDLDEQRVVLSPDSDVDGLSAGVIAARAIERLGSQPVFELAGKGEHIHNLSMLARIREHRPEALIVLDMGSRGEQLIATLPTLLIDRHQPHGIPEGAVVVSASGHDPVATTSLLTFVLCQSAVDITDFDWLAALGTVAELGLSHPFDSVRALHRKYGRKNITDAVALLNAAHRSSGHDVDTALHVLLRARSPADIAEGRIDGVDRLRVYRAEVASEVARCMRIAPVIVGPVALIRIRSTAEVHPAVALRWARRLANNIVLVANDEYLPDSVSFSLRTMLDVNLSDYLQRLGVAREGDLAFGQPKVTGGSMSFAGFEQMLQAMGFGRTAEVEAR